MRLQGKSFSITGALPVSRDAFAAFIVSNGGEFHPNPKRGTQYLIVAETGIYGYTGKMAKAMANGTQIVDPLTVCEWVGVTMSQVKEGTRSAAYGGSSASYKAEASANLR